MVIAAVVNISLTILLYSNILLLSYYRAGRETGHEGGKGENSDVPWGGGYSGRGGWEDGLSTMYGSWGAIGGGEMGFGIHCIRGAGECIQWSDRKKSM